MQNGNIQRKVSHGGHSGEQETHLNQPRRIKGGTEEMVHELGLEARFAWLQNWENALCHGTAV